MLVQHKQISLIGEVWQLPGALAAVPAIGVVVGARRHFVVATDALRQFRPETFAGFHLFQFQNINQSIKSFEGAEMRKGFSQGGGWGGGERGKESPESQKRILQTGRLLASPSTRVSIHRKDFRFHGPCSITRSSLRLIHSIQNN